MRRCSNFFWLVAIAALTLALPAQGALFGEKSVEPVVPNGTLSIAFPFADRLSFNPKGLVLTAAYEASNPKDKGVETIERHHSASGRTPMVFTWPSTWKEAVGRTHVIDKEWIVAKGANRLEIKIPEQLPGPGKYEIIRLNISCAYTCAEDGKDWSHLMEFHDVRNRFRWLSAEGGASRIVVGPEPALTWTADYRGPTRIIDSSDMSHLHKYQYGLKHIFEYPYPTIQDAEGVWHVSPAAYEKERDQAKCPEVSLTDRADVPNISRFPDWTASYATVGVATSAGFCQATDSAWSGCLSVKAQGEENRYDAQERTYQFVEGRLQKLNGHGYGYGKAMIDTHIKFDGDRRLFFFAKRNENVHNNTKSMVYWNRLEHEAYPNEVGPADPSWADQALKEATNALALAREGCAVSGTENPPGSDKKP